MRYGTTLILAVLVFLAAALIYVYRDQLTGEVKPPDKPVGNAPLVQGLKLEDLVSAKLEEAGTDGELAVKSVLKKADGKWRLTEPLDAGADDYEVGRLLRGVVDARVRQTFQPGVANKPTLEAVGLEKPAFRLTLEAAAADKTPARTVVVDIGRKSSGDALYVRVDSGPKVSVIEKADLLERAREKVTAYRVRELITLSREELTRVDLEAEKSKVRIDRAEKEADRWVISQPMVARADPEVSSAIVRALLGAAAKDFVTDAAKDLSDYGLDKPRLTVVLWKKGAEAAKPPETKPEGDKGKEAEKPAAKPEPVAAATLKFGAWADVKREKVYVLAPGGKAVVTVDAAVFRDLNKTVSDLRDKHVLAIDPARATRVTVRVPERLSEKNAAVAYDLVKADGKWTLEVAGRPAAKADAAAVEALLKEMADLKVIYFAEGDQAGIAKGFAVQGAVKVQQEGDAAAHGLEIGATAEAPTLVKNIREDWIARINERDLKELRKGWLEFLDKEVMTVDSKKVTGITIRTTDRKIVLAKKDDKWRLAEPIDVEPQYGFVEAILGGLQSLRCDRFVAVAKDFKPYGLDPAEVVVTVALAPAKEGEKPVERVLRVGHFEKAKVVGHVDDGDLVFEIPTAAFAGLTGEPIARTLTEVPAEDVKRIEVTAGGKKTVVILVDNKWFLADAAGKPAEEVPEQERVNELVKSAAAVSAARWASYDAKDPAKFGLDKPELRIQIGTADTPKATLLVSAKQPPAEMSGLLDQQPQRYAMVDGGERIAILTGLPLQSLLNAPKVLEIRKEEPKKPAEAAK